MISKEKSIQRVFMWSSMLLVLIFMNFPCYGDITKVIFSSPDKPIVVNRKQPLFVIRIKSNPTTGYHWFLGKYDRGLLKPIKREYFPAKTGLVGAGGYEEWTFRMKPNGFLVPQFTELELTCMRPWQMNGHKTKIFEILTID